MPISSITEEEFYEHLWYRSSMVFTKDERELLRRAKVGVMALVVQVGLLQNS